MRVYTRDDVRSDSSSDNDDADNYSAEHDSGAHARFKQYFESHFQPIEGLPQIKTLPERGDTDLSSEASGDWEGLSEDEDQGPVLVDHGLSPFQEPTTALPGKRAFMTSKPPEVSKQLVTKLTSTSNHCTEETSRSEAEDLKKDLALQRLLKESKILDPQSPLNPFGNKRHKTLDLRLQDQGSKSSIYAQARMPWSHRQGIKAKAALKEKERRQSALENGIVLEKPSITTRSDLAKRTRFVGTPSVGRFQKGMLKLSKKDIADIKGPQLKSRKRKR